MLSANKEHFKAPKADRWILRIVPNVGSSARHAALWRDSTFWASSPAIPQVLIDAAKQDGDLRSCRRSIWASAMSPSTNAVRPFNDVAFRRALSTPSTAS